MCESQQLEVYSNYSIILIMFLFNLILLLVKSERMTYIQTQGNYKQAELLSKIP